MFHSVGQEDTNWSQNWLSISGYQLDAFFSYLVDKNYSTVFAKDVTSKLPEGKVVCLTFDDGYLDNYTVLYPLLLKHNIRATIFVNKEFIDTLNVERREMKSLEDIIEGRTKSLGFLNQEEIRFLNSSGLVDIQSHSCSHDYLFCSDELINVYNGEDQYHWLAWNIDKSIKPHWIASNSWKDIVPLGYPVFRYDRALGVRAYIPDSRLVDRLLEDSNYDFEALKREYPGRYETDLEMINRYEYDIGENSRFLEELLNKRIEVLCWPGGGYNEVSLNLVSKFGISISTIGTKHKDEDISASEHFRLKRMGLNSVIRFKEGYKHVRSRRFLIWKFKSGESKLFKYLFILADRLFRYI